jgi:EAL domain-containing protein (putative c-di-GMP-specific phosphodiesterase class I)
VLHYKVISRLHDAQGEALAAGRFLPWLERFGWMARLDLLVLEKVLRHLRGHDQALALNLSAATLADPQALQRVYELLGQHASLGPRLTFEIGEEQLPEQAVLEQLTRRLRGLGFSLALQRFGGRFSMIGNLAHLGLAYLKIDGGYIRNIDHERHKRLFIEAIQRAAHSIDLPLIAERVETEGELKVLREMGVQGIQGQLVGEPAPWKNA